MHFSERLAKVIHITPTQGGLGDGDQISVKHGPRRRNRRGDQPLNLHGCLADMLLSKNSVIHYPPTANT